MKLQHEIIYLFAVKELIASMTSNNIISVSGQDPESSVRFSSMEAARIFNIFFVDLLSKTDDSAPVDSDVKKIGYIDALMKIVQQPAFSDAPISNLATATKTLAEWIKVEIEENVNLPSLDVQLSMKVKIEDYIEICGNVSKHNVMRTWRVVKRLQKVLKANGMQVCQDKAVLALKDFDEWFHCGVLYFDVNVAAEMLNNISHGLRDYLWPEFCRSYKCLGKDSHGLKRWRYDYPQEISEGFQKYCYFELMEFVRRRASTRRFIVGDVFRRNLN